MTGAGPSVVAAVDLGASSGRVVMVRIWPGRAGAGRLEAEEVHRFANAPVSAGGTLYWDILRLYLDMLDGLSAAGRNAELSSIGVDSWGVDYGLLDASGALLGNPVHYRDARTEGAVERLLARVPADELYQVTGIQQLPINTICQLVAAAGTAPLQAAATLLLIPDLICYWLTGEVAAEITNASTTQLLDVRTHAWASSLMDRAGVRASVFPRLRDPGEVIGELLPNVAAQAGLDGRARPRVIAVGSHDTASAVAAVPADGRHFAYISCGTWSLVGMELDHPVLSEDSRLANFSNETGIDGTIRYLRNVAGLWLLQESLRTWAAAGPRVDLADLLTAAAAEPALAAVIDPDLPAFLAAGDIPSRIAQECQRTGQRPPQAPAGTVRCILDSLALAHRRVVLEVQELSGRHADAVHIVGGGSQNELLCQLTANACGLPVVAGPAEAAALGNALVQARTLNAAPPDLAGMRALVRRTQQLRRFEPDGDTRPWRAAQQRLA
jgi:rhamnulokinase